jgi:hypothetical protein
MILLFLCTLYQDEKIIAAKDLNWNKTNSGFKSMLFCESQARFSTQVFSLFNFAEQIVHQNGLLLQIPGL